MKSSEFSFRSRDAALNRFKEEVFDLLIIGGGITGAATARDAASRGLKVALVERRDFAFGTSSRSSKLIHGGLRYLQNFELGLVFEALAERALLLKTVPHMVRPIPFFLPVYRGDSNGPTIMGLGLWLYDLLALFRAPGIHKRLSQKRLLAQIPFLNKEGLLCGFRYFDASMWDDVLAVETLRAAHIQGVAVANYVEAVSPQWEKDRVVGFRVRDLEQAPGRGEIDLRAHRVIVCAGPWTDHVGAALSPRWRPWLSPSKGVHLVFDLKKIPVPGAVVMGQPDDGRIAFVIPRTDFGQGVAIVGTTDGPTPRDPEQAEVDPSDVEYLMGLLHRYFPKLDLKISDILSAYVGVRPLMGATASVSGSEGQVRGASSEALQKVSREHHIGVGPGGTVIVAGGKYTTHRRMAQEVVDFALKLWRRDAHQGKVPPLSTEVGPSRTLNPVNPNATASAMEASRHQSASQGIQVPEELFSRYGAEAIDIVGIQSRSENASFNVSTPPKDPDGFPFLAAQLRHNLRTGMVMHLADFYFRRIPLFACRSDHGLPWAQVLAQIWAEERGFGQAEAEAEVTRLYAEVERNTAWTKVIPQAKAKADPGSEVFG